MSFIDDIIHRGIEGRAREEDYASIYYDGGCRTILEEGTYRDHEYIIETTSRRPLVKIKEPINPRTVVIKARSSPSIIELPDRNGEKKTFVCYRDEMVHDYNYGGDFVLNYRDGKKYTVEELKDDVKSFIDAILERKSKSK